MIFENVPHAIADIEVAGIPAPFATTNEATWKAALRRAIPSPAPPALSARAIDIEFLLKGDANGPPDVDNLCEPVLSVLVNEKGWCSGKRPHLTWLRASKQASALTGCRIRVWETFPPRLVPGFPVFAGIYSGPLPRRATDLDLPSWLVHTGWSPTPFVTCAVVLRFGGSMANLGDIATGRVKAIIDCLWPILGGRPGAPNDGRVTTLELSKGTSAVLNGAVEIALHGLLL